MSFLFGCCILSMISFWVILFSCILILIHLFIFLIFCPTTLTVTFCSLRTNAFGTVTGDHIISEELRQNRVLVLAHKKYWWQHNIGNLRWKFIGNENVSSKTTLLGWKFCMAIQPCVFNRFWNLTEWLAREPSEQVRRPVWMSSPFEQTKSAINYLIVFSFHVEALVVSFDQTSLSRK